MAKRKARRTVSNLKKKAWSACSIYIRKSYADYLGYVTCYTCGIRKHYKEMQAGHGFAGRHKAVLFMEEVIRPQCFGCNVPNAGRLDIFTYKLRKELGDKRFEELFSRVHHSAGQWTSDELQEKLEYYQLKGGYNENG